MSADEPKGPLGEVVEELDEGGLVEPVVVRSHGHWRRAWKVTKRGLLAILVLALVAAAGVWLMRKQIADDQLSKMFRHKGVQASYHLDRIGLRTQQVSNLVIGDPANPDLTARIAQVQMRIRWNGAVEVYRVAARGVRLHGRVIGNKVSWGQVDKLLPPPSGKPFRLPDLAVDLADTAVRLDTPYGRLGFAVVGAGNLSGGFKGRLAASGPHLQPGRCTLDRLKANVAVEVIARHPHVVGPVYADRFECAVSRIALAKPRMEIDSRFAEAFDSFDGHGRLSFASMVAGTNGLANATSNLTFKGTPTLILGRFDLAAQQARLAQIYADQTKLDGRYRLGAASGTLDLIADYSASSVAVDPALLAGLTNGLAGAAKTPIGPITTAIARAISTTARRFDVDGGLSLVNRPGEGAVRINSASARAPSGARVDVAGGDGITYYWPSQRIRIDTNIQTRGGGLPSADITLRQPRGGGAISGVADIAPYAAGGSRLALAPVRFSALPDGGTRIDTVALLDGSFGSGRVTGLRLPISGRFGGRAGLRVGEGCIDARFASLQYGVLRLGPTRLPLCPTSGGALIAQAPGGKLMIGAGTRNLALNGQLGKSPFRLTAASARMVGDKAFEAAALALRLGRPETPVLINAATLKGSFQGSGVSGTFARGDATIGNVPLRLSDAAGRWLVHDGDLTLDGAMTVADRADPARFYPLRSQNVHMTLANDVIRATGTLNHPASGTAVTDVLITHRLSTGVGEATLDVPGIRFATNGLQPSDLSRLTEGLIALVNGEVNGQGRINWTGGGQVSSTGRFNIVDTDLAAPFGPVTGINTTINFSDLLGLRTGPGQTLTMTSINPGILVQNGVVNYQLLPDRLVKIERGEWPFMGGRLILRETVLNFNRPTAKRLTFEVVGLDAHTFVSSMGFQEIDASGVFDGVLPMVFDESGGRIVGGRLDSREGGGTLAYNGVVNKANIGMFGGLAFDALRDLRFKSMIIRLDGYLDGEFATRLTVEGVGLGNTSTQRLIRAINRIPFKFNVTIKGPFRALIATAKSFKDPRPVISDALPLEDIPGIVTEVRSTNEQKQQTQTPVDEQVTVGTKPTP